MDVKKILSPPVKLAIAAFVVAGAASAQQIKNAIPDVARPLPLAAVRLTGGPLKRALRRYYVAPHPRPERTSRH